MGCDGSTKCGRWVPPLEGAGAPRARRGAEAPRRTWLAAGPLRAGRSAPPSRGRRLLALDWHAPCWDVPVAQHAASRSRC
jgi:hypothetical protein